ncbi:MAG: hypothetical protein ACRDJ3_01195 [Solirubrobacteraceae bacterium]
MSPPYKEGYNLFALNYSPDGDRAILSSLANLAGASGTGESVPEANMYLGTRTSGGWRIVPLSAPVSSFVGQIPLAYEAARGLTLWDQHTPREPAITRGLYIRDAEPTPNYEFVGLLNPVAGGEEESDVIQALERNYDRPVAATEDFHHIVVFAPSPDDYWTSFDETAGAGGSLYEYSGTGNTQPVLVGVEGEEKGATSLIGLCDTELGGGREGSAYNALSGDGETIFFSVAPQGETGCSSVAAPEVVELYARVHGAVTSSLSGETVHVSESECTEACGAVSGGNLGKNFEGASWDGRSVYFTSTQKLVNDAVDGTASGTAAEGLDRSGQTCATTTEGLGGCNLYLYDFARPEHERLITVAAGEVLGVSAIAQDGARVYFVDRAVLSGAGENPYHTVPQTGGNNLYVYDATTGVTGFVATLGGEQEDWQREFFRPVQVTGEHGRFLLFASAAPELTPDDHTGVTQLFEYAAGEGAKPAELVRVTQGEAGYNDNGNSVASGVRTEQFALLNQRSGRSLDFQTAANSLNISSDGMTVVFETVGRLSPYATSAQPTASAPRGCTSVYEFHTAGALSKGSVHLVSDGRDSQPNRGTACGAGFMGMDATGDNVLIETADALVPSDLDGVQRDVYDVRVDGGFPSVVASGSCAGGGCEGSASTPPLFAAPASTVLTGPGNLDSLPAAAVRPVKSRAKLTPRRCPRGKRLVHRKCIKVRPSRTGRATTTHSRRAK